MDVANCAINLLRNTTLRDLFDKRVRCLSKQKRLCHFILFFVWFEPKKVVSTLDFRECTRFIRKQAACGKSAGFVSKTFCATIQIQTTYLAGKGLSRTGLRF